MALALEGIRILDMAWLGPGPFCANMLGDLGADVIKIYEAHPERRGGPVMFLFDPTMQPGFRNCRTMGLNLKAEEGRSIFCDLAKNADVIMEGFRPGVVKRLGVDYDTIKKINPRIVYASLTGFGQNGPYHNLVGHDINYIGIGGLLGLTGPAGGAPVIPGTVIADFAAGGMSSAIGILAALMARERTGMGQFVDMSMTDAVVESTSMQISPYLLNGMVPKKGETMFTGHYPWYNVYETRDGKYISIGALEPWFFANLCELLGCEQLIEHQFAEGEKREEIFKYFRETFLSKTRDEWVAILQQKDTCVAPVYDINELESDPQLIARRMIIEVDHPTMGRVKQVGSMHKLSDSPVEVRNWSIRFGQHTEEIILELGYDKTHIDELFKAEVIG
jgi:crotonobetainyl-CoA:carnitine CoA-transferase CaiB-like acyl-CoA transferase